MDSYNANKLPFIGSDITNTMASPRATEFGGNFHQMSDAGVAETSDEVESSSSSSDSDFVPVANVKKKKFPAATTRATLVDALS